ncbi:putative peptidoglycan lipid II flippase [Leifsonia naganoensis]|uniref:Putative peptidoglycan lipid II flippase n=1 Tax=Leifsonia naganoensis TaxID=150025 RepID=A0A853DN75_9MICO|nr:putative peptidoglycan lipid II flippase [Leifsonia naganoensis]
MATLASRLTGFVRNVVLVLLIGGTAAAVGGQAFGVSNELPTQIYGLIAGGLLGAVLVPDIVRATRNERHDDLNRLVTMTLTAALALTALLTWAAPGLVRLLALGWPDEWLELATSMAYWCIPQVFFFVVYAVLSQVLNAHHNFAPAAWAPVLSNLIALAGLGAFALVFRQASDSVDGWTSPMVTVLAGTATLGVVAQSALLLFFLRKLPFSLRIRFGVRGLASTGRTAGIAFFGIIAGQLAFLVVSNVANAAGAQLHAAGTDGASLNSLNNAYLVSLLPHGVFAVAITTAVFTRMSHHVEERRRDDFNSDLSTALQRIAYISGLFTVVLVAFGRLIGSVLWNSEIIGDLIALLSIGLSAFSQLYALNRAALALRSGSSVFLTQVIVAAITAIGAIGAMLAPADYTVPIIAGATSAANIVGYLLALRLISRTDHSEQSGFRARAVLRSHLPITLTAVLLSTAGWAAMHFAFPVPGSWWIRVIELCIAVAVATAAFVGLAWLLGDRTIRELFSRQSSRQRP